MDQLADLKLSATALNGRVRPSRDQEPEILRVTTNPEVDHRSVHAFLSLSSSNLPEGFGAYLLRACEAEPSNPKSFEIPHDLAYLSDGDVIRINPRQGQLWVMYRRSSRTNSILLTERCNSWCVMCSQPPKQVDDSWLVSDWLEAIPLMSPDTEAIGFTGGEPTLLGDKFLELASACRDHLPATALHILSNGRMFNYLTLARALAELQHPDMVIGIPLYSDVAWRHEHVVQAAGSFDQTVRGILNLARCNVRIEIRVVLHRLTVDRLPQLATFISRNLPFVEHVALMGLEPIGFGRANIGALWLDPVSYQDKLVDAVMVLATNGMNISIYNHQLCVLREELWPFARQSISDWKNIYLPQCRSCTVQTSCGGFFHSAVDAHSQHIVPIKHSVRSSGCTSWGY